MTNNVTLRVKNKKKTITITQKCVKIYLFFMPKMRAELTTYNNLFKSTNYY